MKKFAICMLVLAVAAICVPAAQAQACITLTNFCGASVAPGANCQINVSFQPTAINKLKATLNIADNAAGSPQTVRLSGTGK